MGTFEGYVAGPSDIYNQGAWGAGTKNYSIKNGTFQQTAMFPTGSTTSGGRTSFYLYFRKNCIGYAKMIVEGTGLASSSIKAGSFISRAGVHLGTDTKLIFDLSAGIAHLGEASFECDFACYKVTKIYLN